MSVWLSASGTQKLTGPYAALTRIQSPHEMVAAVFPKRYRVPVKLSGSIAQEIVAILDTMDIDKPQYAEHYDRKRGFVLHLVNEQFPAQTGEMISGILNPVDMTGAVLHSFLKYRNSENLIAIQNETTIEVNNRHKDGRTEMCIVLKPKGTRFCYEYSDFGAYLRESWLSLLSVVVDSATMLAQELTLHRHHCEYNAAQQERPPAEVVHQRFVFSYTTMNGSVLPSRLDLYVDSLLTLTFSARYRRNGSSVMFDTRKITYFFPEKATSSLVMTFGEYNLNARKRSTKRSSSLNKYGKKLRRAAAYSRKATEALNSGQIERAVHLMKTIIENCPDTPQAVEAQKLLSGLQIDF